MSPKVTARTARRVQSEQRADHVIEGAGLASFDADLSRHRLPALRIIMDVETAGAFDELTRSNKDDLLSDQSAAARPNNLRHARFIPAVEYVQANRARTLLMRRMEELLEGIDVFVAPSLHDTVLMLTNLTGHPCAVVPNGFTEDNSPVSISFVGNLFKDAETLAVAHAYQRATDFHLRHPPRFIAGRQPDLA